MLRAPKWLRLPYLPVILAPVILFFPILVTGQAIYWGTPYLQFFPWRSLAFEILKSGALPLWNPQVGMGAPLMANYQSALFYPTTWLLFAFQAMGGVPLMAWGQTLVVIFQLILAGMGMIYLCRSLKLSILSQTIAGLAYCMCGYLVARIGFLSINAAASWIPWIILAGSRIAGPETDFLSLRSKPVIKIVFPLMICLVFQLLGGHAQITFYTLLLLAAWIVFWSYQTGKFRAVVIATGYTILAVLGAFVIAAIQLVPTAEYLLQSQRASSVPYDIAMNYSFFPLRLLTLFAANLFGTPAQGNYLLHADNYWEDAIYFGLIPLILAFAGFWKSLKPGSTINPDRSSMEVKTHKKLALFLLVIVLCSLVLALGDNSPVFPFLYRYIPTFNLFQAPARFTILAEFGLIMLAALGANLWRRPEGKARAWTRRGIAFSVSVLMGSFLGLFLLPGIQTAFVTALAIFGVLGIGLGFMNLYLPAGEGSRKQIWMVLLVFIIGLDLLVADWGLVPGISLDAYRISPSDLEQVNSLRGSGRVYLDYLSENTLKFDTFFQFNNFINNLDISQLRTSLLPDSNILAGIPSANNFDPLVPERYSTWMNYLIDASPQAQAQMYSLMDVSLVEFDDPLATDGVSFTQYKSQKITWSNCAISAKDESDAWHKTISQVENSAQPVASEPLVLENTTGVGTSTCNPSGQAIITSLSESANRTNIEIKSPSVGWMMIANTWYPGWVAYVDGMETPVLHADYLFMAVQVPEGQHSVEFVYKPFSFYLGAVLSVLGIGLVVLAFKLAKEKM